MINTPGRWTWRKSTFSESNGNSDCVEITWVEEAAAVRDSKNPDGAMLLVPPGGWSAFCAKIAR